MPGAYTYTPAIWPPLVAAAFLGAIGHYTWRRRDVPGGRPFLAMSVLSIALLLGIAFEAAAVAPATILAWQKLQFVMLFAGVIPVTCLALDYGFPGRWLTRRNLALLSIPFLLCLLLIMFDGSRLIWRPAEAGAGGKPALRFAPAGAILVAYAMAMFAVNVGVFLHVFIRSPQHRWPVAIMLLAQVGTRLTFLLDTANPPAVPLVDFTLIVVLVPWTGYAIALFGFRLLDPLPFARQAVIEQMHAGVVVFDAGWRLACLNPAAETALGVSEGGARGKTWQQVAGPETPLPAFPDASPDRDDQPPEGAEMMLGPRAHARDCAEVRWYAPTLSELRDFRGLLTGHLLMLRDVTEERRAQAQVVQQQRSLAALQERERLARELHDSTGQVLGYVGLQLEVICDRIRGGLAALSDGEREQVSASLAEAENRAARLGSIVEEAHADVREHIMDLRLAPSEQRPFFATLGHYLDGYCQNYGIQAGLSVGPGIDESRLDASTQTELFRIIQEALSNARRHAAATSVQVTFETGNGGLRMLVEDNGRGFDPALAAKSDDGHFGLRTMRERAEQVGGTLDVRSAPGAGTCVVADLPLQRGEGQS
jgi:signal transduction histidine kinase